MTAWRVAVATCGIVVGAGLLAATTEDRPALSPAQALATFVVEPGYRMDLVAAEPLVADPVAIAFDEHGALYVAENHGYPDPLEGEPPAPAAGVIARLTDRDGDGVFDTRTVFADGLTYPNGLLVWEGGLFVTVAPDLLYLKDTTGDGVADERRVVLTGFNATRTAQIRFSHPTLGPDGWIYLTSGLNGGEVTAPAHPDRPPVTFTSSDSRVHPRSHAFELVGGQGQYGLTFDEAGRRFICANRHPVWHVVLEPSQLRRNPSLAFSDTVHEVSTVGAAARVWPLTRDMTTASFHPTLINTPHAGTFTSASGVHIHRGDALPAGHQGSLFVMESAQNLVQRQVRTADGVTFRSAPARDGVEFLASRDTWFRPVFAAAGPDGALYVVDMYRKDIDHPAYVPEASRRLFDFTAGRGMGRIYRLAAANRPPGGLARAPGADDDATLVARLDAADGWQRETAQRLLVERGRPDAVTALRALASRGGARGRLHALWTLDALGALRDDDLGSALRDEDAAIRENAARIVERRLPTAPHLLDGLMRAADDPDARVRLHVALALGASPDVAGVEVLAAMARRDGADRWMRAALLSSVGARTGAFMEAFVRVPSAPPVRAAVMRDLGHLFGVAEPAERCLALVAEIADPAEELTWQAAALAGVADGMRTRGLAQGTDSALMTLVAVDTPVGRLARERLHTQMARAIALATLEVAPPEQRLPAIALLGHGSWSTVGTTLLTLTEPRQQGAVQMAAVAAVAQQRHPDAARALVAPTRWHGYSPRVRDAVLGALLAEERLVAVLLDAIERGDVPAASLGASRWRRLTTHRAQTIRARADRLHAAGETGTALQVFERLQADVLRRPGVPARGATTFAAHCAACHTFDGGGGRVGPDLSGIRNQPVDALLLHILVPDYEITPGYEAYTVLTRDGRTLFGRVESEAPNSLTLRDAVGQAHTVLRGDVASISAATASLMPGDFDQALTPQALADLLAHLTRAVP